MLCFMLGMVLGIPVLIRLSQLRGTRFGVACAMLGAALSSLAFTAIPSGGATTAMIAYSLVGLFTGAISRSEEHTSELQSLMRISYAVFCLNKKTTRPTKTRYAHHH